MTFRRRFATFIRFIRFIRNRINAAVLLLAGHASLADLEHVGRRSGVVRHTPLRAVRRGDTVVVGVGFGPESDWLKNIRAAGRCRMRLGRELLELGEPRIVPVQQGLSGMPWWFGLGLRYVIRTVDCVQLPVISSSPVPPRRPRSEPGSP